MTFDGRRSSTTPGPDDLLSLFFLISIKKLFELGRAYPFPRPPNCLRCKGGRLWGHGFREVWFEGHTERVPLKRYQCAECGCVYTIRPYGYWPRHHVSATVIFSSLCYRIRNGAWERDNGLTRQRQGNWLRAFVKNIKLYLGMHSTGNVVERFCGLIDRGKLPVLRAG